MPTGPPAPGVAQTFLKGLIGAQPWAMVLHFQAGTSTAPIPLSNLHLINTTIQTRWAGAWLAFVGNNVTLKEVSSVDIGSSTGLFDDITFTPIPGTQASPLEPSSLCFVVNCKIAARYRGGHPRLYIPAGGQATMTNESNWLPNFVTNCTNAWQTFMSNVLGDLVTGGFVGAIHTIPRYTYSYSYDSAHHKVLKVRTGYVGSFPVQQYIGRPVVGSQRRRLTN